MNRGSAHLPIPRLLALSIAWYCVVAGGETVAAENVGVFLEPEIGGSWVRIKSLEIEQSFIAASDSDDADNDDWESVDPGSVQKTVGRKSYYTGSGLSLGGSIGLKLFNVNLGVAYLWDSITLDGYSKRYRYDPMKNRAGGRKFWDTGVADFHRVMAQIGYMLPIWKLHLKFQTRIGAIYLDEGPLIVGRAIDDASGFAGDLGIGLSYSPFTFLSIGIEGYFGFFSFSGTYEGAYGTIGGLCGNIAFHI